MTAVISNGTWSPPNCSPSTFVNYTGNISSSAQVAFNLDADGNAVAMLVDGVETLITAHDADERIKAESFQPYASPSPSYTLTYTYDADGHVIDKGGTLAAVNFPQAASASYSNTDQITMWNSTATKPDNASNIIDDPNGLTFKWNARNMISTIGGSVAALFSYDGLGRRETSNATPPSAIQDFEYDGSSMIGWNTLGSSPSYNFLTIPGGGALAGSFTSGGTTTTWVPLIDASGSTLGLWNAASPQSGLATTYTYDPSGTPTASGAANEWPFQYQGMEKEFTDPGPYYYSGSGQFYSPQFVRSLSEAGETSSSQGACPSRNAIGAPSDSSGGGLNFPSGAFAQPENSSEGQTGRTTITVTGAAGAGATIGAIIGAAVGHPLAGAAIGTAVGAIVGGIASVFDDLFGGGGAPPTPRQLLHGRHPLYPIFLGVQDGLIPDETSAGAPEFVGDLHPKNAPPLQSNGNVLEIGPEATPTATPTLTLEQLWQIAKCSGLSDEALLETYQGLGVPYNEAVWLVQHRILLHPSFHSPNEDPGQYHGCAPKPVP
jgi:hypothetical protein